VRFDFEAAEERSHAAISALDAGFGYPGAARPLFSGLRFRVHGESRIGVVGRNGGGKSTLLRLLARRLECTAGEITADPRCVIGVYDQHFEQQLGGDLGLSALRHLQGRYP
jgi:ATPase subunit of ABC transporter with duplicated ATPase domains